MAATVFRTEYSSYFTQIYVFLDRFLVMSPFHRYTLVAKTNNIH